MKTKYSKNEIEEQSHFNLMAKKYDINYGYNDLFTKFKINKKVNELKKFVKNSIKKDNLIIVELGCGTGEYTKKISKAFPKAKIVAIDISKGIVNVARQKCRNFKNIKFKVASAYNTGLPKNSVDLVCGYYFLHHVNYKLVNNEMEKILKNKGLVFFYEPNILNPVVYLIKSNKFLKEKAGDSPDEWAINPLKIHKSFPKMVVQTETSEFIPPLRSLPYELLKILDTLMSTFSKIPVVKYLGGSVAIKMHK